MNNRHFVIGIDGGGTKTVAALATSRGKIIKRVSGGSSNPNKVGFDAATFCLGELLWSLIRGIPREKIGSIYLAVAAALERDFQRREQIKRALLLKFPKLKSFARKIKIEGDQKAAFRSGTDEKDGVVLIAGTGSIAMGWRGGKEVIAGGWDYIMGDQGSAFWVGQELLRAVCRELDERGPKTQFLSKLLLSHWKIKKESDLYRMVYRENMVEMVASLAVLADRAAQKGDRTARSILARAGRELAVAAATVIKKLRFQKEQFPLVLIGGMFQSPFISEAVRREIKKIAPYGKIIRPVRGPVTGAIKLALEGVKNGNHKNYKAKL